MLESGLPARDKLVYFVSGFCLALLLILGWRYMSSRPPLAQLPLETIKTTVAHPPFRPPVSIGSLPPSAGNPPRETRSEEVRGGAQPIREGLPQAEAPPQLNTAPPERATQLPSSATAEENHEALRRFVQESLQQTIDEDDNLRAVLREAAKAHLMKGKEEPR